jgi:hypothetical protein
MRGTEGSSQSEDRWLEASPAKGPKDDADVEPAPGDDELGDDDLELDDELDDDDLDDDEFDDLDDDLIDLDDEYDIPDEVERDKPPIQKRYDE